MQIYIYYDFIKLAESSQILLGKLNFSISKTKLVSLGSDMNIKPFSLYVIISLHLLILFQP